MFDYLKGRKTYFVSIIMIVYAVTILGWQMGQWESAIKMILEAIGLTTLRAGVSKRR